MDKVLAVMTMNDSMDGRAFAVFIEKFLCPELWKGAVVVMDNTNFLKFCYRYSL
jgi:putative transposase